MSTSTRDTEPEPATAPGVPPSARTLSLTVLSLLIEAAAANLGAAYPTAADEDTASVPHVDLTEARFEIDGAVALLGALREALEHDERIAMESVLAQLQVEYVKRVG